MIIRSDQITGLILAGGRATRMGGVDKGLQLFRGYPLVMHVLLRVAPQVGPIVISAVRNTDSYQALGHPIVADSFQEIGPLGGLHAGLMKCQTPYLLAAPCDTPFLPADLASRLASAADEDAADVAVAKTGGRLQPLCCLMRGSVLAWLGDYIGKGGRRADGWYDGLRVVEVGFDDQPLAFTNLNTLQDLAEQQGSNP